MAEEILQEEGEPTGTQDPQPSRAAQANSWDKERQFRDELAAANRREGELSAKLDETNRRLEAMEMQKAEGEEVDLDDYDNLKNYVVQQSSALKAIQQENASLKRQAEETHKQHQSLVEEQNRRDRQAEGTRLLNAHCDQLDKKFGSKEFRNTAMNVMTKEFHEKGIGNITDAAARKTWIEDKLELEYRRQAEARALEKADPKKKTTSAAEGSEVSLDTGQGGSTPTDEIPEGSFEEVTKAMNERDRRAAGIE